ncbi:hypothetical protein TNCV_4638181 [Trichonephila clavipes]|uniref:Uncharacterized protein n=1 Tax=Trichonephila clavipes TaxID=2585209 RepID=A0A8X6WDS7_TRICX|nr:hypothetical protein TNCV_4638181 [Trichonephila clavipes]
MDSLLLLLDGLICQTGYEASGNKVARRSDRSEMEIKLLWNNWEKAINNFFIILAFSLDESTVYERCTSKLEKLQVIGDEPRNSESHSNDEDVI